MHKSSYVFLFLFICNISQAACPWSAPKDLLICSREQIQGESRTLSVEEIKEDLDCLKQVYKKQYIAEYYYSQSGISLTNLVSDFQDTLTASMTQQELMKKIVQTNNLAYDAHFGLLLEIRDHPSYIERSSMYSIYYVNVPFNKSGDSYISQAGSKKITGCKDFQPFPVLSKQGQTAGHYFIGQFNNAIPSFAKCFSDNALEVQLPITKLELNQLNEKSHNFHFEVRDNSYLYVRIPSFTPGISQEQQKLLDFLQDETLSYPIVFDLRQNMGGDSTFAIALAKVLKSTDEKISYPSQTDKKSLYTMASFTNFFYMMWQQSLQNNDHGAAAYEEQYKKYLNEFNVFASKTPDLDFMELQTNSFDDTFGNRKMVYPSKIILLFDKFCASACEYMMDVFSGMRNVVKIGSHSGGFLHFGNVGLSVLPHSKIAVYSGMSYFEYSTQVEEGRGYAPDYYSLDDNSLEATIQYLRNSR